MNHGFKFADQRSFDWLLFWGSDDWASDPHVFSSVFSFLESTHCHHNTPDLIVCRGRYFHGDTGVPGRYSVFNNQLSLSNAFRRALFFGATPPHQATFIGRGSRKFLNHYSSDFRLSADLDYFLSLSSSSSLWISCLDLNLVCMSDSGISGQLPTSRLMEVVKAYFRAFALLWVIPFFARYFRRVYSLLIR